MPTTHDRLTAVDLRDLTEEELSLLRQGAIEKNMSLPEYLGSLVVETSKKLLNRHKGEEP